MVPPLKFFLKERDFKLAKDFSLPIQSKIGNSRWLEPNLVDVLRNPGQ